MPKKPSPYARVRAAQGKGSVRLPAPGRRWPLSEPVRWYHVARCSVALIGVVGWLLLLGAR